MSNTNLPSTPIFVSIHDENGQEVSASETRSIVKEIESKLLVDGEVVSLIPTPDQSDPLSFSHSTWADRYVDVLVIHLPSASAGDNKTDVDRIIKTAQRASAQRRYGGICVAMPAGLFLVEFAAHELQPFIADQAILRSRFYLPQSSNAVQSYWQSIVAEKIPWLMLRLWYPLLLLLFSGRLPSRRELRPRPSGETVPANPSGSVGDLKLLAGKLDAIAGVYAQRYRSAFVGRFVLALIVSVFAALTLFAFPQWQTLAYGLEFLATLAIVGSYLVTAGRNWQSKWLSCRALAESLRIMLALPTVSDHFLLSRRAFNSDTKSDEDLLLDWCARQRLGDPASWETQSLSLRQSQLNAAIAEQAAYHKKRAREQMTTEKRMGLVGVAAFVGSMTLALTALLGSTFLPEYFTPFEQTTALVLGILPAIGAAMLAIRVQSNFRIDALSSELLQTRLSALLTSSKECQTYRQLQQTEQEFVQVQRQEFEEWRKIQMGRALDLPE